MRDEISDARFIPYIQLHEFEALLFTDLRGFEYCGFESKQLQQLQAIIDEYATPEEINNHPETAPSKRLLKIIPKYNKLVFANIIAQENGFPSLLSKCPRFNEWVALLIEKAKS